MSKGMQALLNAVGWGSLVLGGSFVVAQTVLYNVDGGQRAVLFDRIQGVQKDVIAPGTHFYVPWLQRPHIFDVKMTPRNVKTETSSKDLQPINITLRLLYRPQVANLPEIFKRFGLDYDERILPSLANEVMKSVVAQYDAVELITQRETVSNKIRENLTKRATEFHINLEDVSITHLSFSDDYTRAVEQKQVAQQEAERSKYVVAKTEQEKIAAIIRAEAEAQAAALISKAMSTGTGFIELRRIEAAREITESLSHNKNVVYLPQGAANMLLSLPTFRNQQ
jgi:prohibitin 1